VVPISKLRELYTVLVQDVRTMFQVCRLVHADLSEYNILYSDGRLAIIDVSQVRGGALPRGVCAAADTCSPQSVDLDHPRCFDFLREDLTHVNDFFSRKGARQRVREGAPAPRHADGVSRAPRHRHCDGARAVRLCDGPHNRAAQHGGVLGPAHRGGG
jgi:serine/threonine-protein kinase RIO1